VSALFAVASVPLVAALAARLAGRGPALVATVLLAASWMLLFHGVYGRMYSIFLFTSTLSFLALLRATERGGVAGWAIWAAATLLCVSSHPYGAIVLAAQGVYVLAGRIRLREALPAFAAVAVLGIPFWRTDLVLAGRFEIGVGGRGERLGGPLDVLRYLKNTAADFSAGYLPALVLVLLLCGLGYAALVRRRKRSALLVAAAVLTPTGFLLLARFGSAAAPESRHLIFVLPFFVTLLGAGMVEAAGRLPRWQLPALACVVAALVACEVAWGWNVTADLYRGEPAARIAARSEAAAWLAETTRPDDVLFGYDPLFLQAWQRGGRVSQTVVPRADARLALRTLERLHHPLGRGLWVFDASDTGNASRQLHVPLRIPQPHSAFEARTFGPFLVVRTTAPTGSVRSYLVLARRAQLTGKSLAIGDAETNLLTVLEASRRLADYERDRRAAASRSSASR
jgi:hypothetical protein